MKSTQIYQSTPRSESNSTKLKKRVKTLVNVIEAQNTLLRRLVRKIDPDAELDARSLDQIFTQYGRGAGNFGSRLL